MQQLQPEISWPEVVKFIRQLNHDLRNHLNAVELQGAYVSEIVEGEEAKAEMKRLRELNSELSHHLQRLSHSLGKIEPVKIQYSARDLVEDLRASFERARPEEAAGVEWQISLGEESLEIDPQLLQEAFLELFANALQHGRAAGKLVFTAQIEGDSLTCTLREPKTAFDRSTENWGTHPLGHVWPGHYSLGLFRARSIFEQHHGSFRAHFDPAAGELQTTISLPLASR